MGKLFRQRFRREIQEGTDVMHFAEAATESLVSLIEGVKPPLIVILSDISMPEIDGLAFRYPTIGDVASERTPFSSWLIVATVQNAWLDGDNNRY